MLPPRKPGAVRISSNVFSYEIPGVGERSATTDMTVDYTLDRTLTSKRNGRVMNLVDQVSIAKLQAKAEEELKAGNVDRATRLLGNAMQGTQRLGNVKATQALAGLLDQVKKTQTLADQGGQDHAAAGAGCSEKDPDARSGSIEGVRQGRIAGLCFESGRIFLTY